MTSIIKNIQTFDDIIADYNPHLNSSRNTLTKYERALIIGMRLEQLARGAKPYIDFKRFNLETIQQIAEKELKEKVIPFMIIRLLPNGLNEYWKLSDFNI